MKNDISEEVERFWRAMAVASADADKFFPWKKELFLGPRNTLNERGQFARRLSCLLAIEEALLALGADASEKRVSRYLERQHLKSPCRRVFFRIRRELVQYDMARVASLYRQGYGGVEKALPFLIAHHVKGNNYVIE
jgi:hypothetical protein